MEKDLDEIKDNFNNYVKDLCCINEMFKTYFYSICNNTYEQDKEERLRLSEKIKDNLHSLNLLSDKITKLVDLWIEHEDKLDNFERNINIFKKTGKKNLQLPYLEIDRETNEFILILPNVIYISEDWEEYKNHMDKINKFIEENKNV